MKIHILFFIYIFLIHNYVGHLNDERIKETIYN